MEEAATDTVCFLTAQGTVFSSSCLPQIHSQICHLLGFIQVNPNNTKPVKGWEKKWICSYFKQCVSYDLQHVKNVPDSNAGKQDFEAAPQLKYRRQFIKG